MIRFTPKIERLMMRAVAIVGMGGYNTFCEILSFDKPTLLVPRVVPRREQAIRARRAEEAGLLSVLPIDKYPDVEVMTEALKKLPKQPAPSAAGHNGLLGGLGHGEVVVVNEKFGIRLTDVVSPADRIKNLR